MQVLVLSGRIQAGETQSEGRQGETHVGQAVGVQVLVLYRRRSERVVNNGVGRVEQQQVLI